MNTNKQKLLELINSIDWDKTDSITHKSRVPDRIGNRLYCSILYILEQASRLCPREKSLEEKLVDYGFKDLGDGVWCKGNNISINFSDTHVNIHTSGEAYCVKIKNVFQMLEYIKINKLDVGNFGDEVSK